MGYMGRILFFSVLDLIFLSFYRLCRSVWAFFFGSLVLSSEYTGRCVKIVRETRFYQLQTDVKYMLENIVLMNFFGKMFGGNGGKV